MGAPHRSRSNPGAVPCTFTLMCSLQQCLGVYHQCTREKNTSATKVKLSI